MFKTAYGEHHRHQITFPEETRTKQSFKDECDINRIMSKYEKTGLVNHLNRFEGNYGDATGLQDYHTSLNQVLAAQEAFETLPARIRRRFQNNPGEFLSFMENPENQDEAIALGLLPTTTATQARGGPQGSTPPDLGTPSDLSDQATTEAKPTNEQA